MKTEWSIQVRAFPVTVHAQGVRREETVVLTREQLRAARLVGQSGRELIGRLCERAGLTVLEIGRPEKREIRLNMEELFRFHSIVTAGRREAVT